MDKKRIEIIITSILVLAFIFFLGNSIRQIRARSKKKASSSFITEELLPVPRQEKKHMPEIDREEFDRKLTYVRCPFSARVYRTARKEDEQIKLEGIIWDAKRPMAVINGLILIPGDEINANTIVTIEKDRVILNDGTQDMELRLD